MSPSLQASVLDLPGSGVFSLHHFCLEPSRTHSTALLQAASGTPGCRLWSMVTSLVASEWMGAVPCQSLCSTFGLRFVRVSSENRHPGGPGASGIHTEPLVSAEKHNSHSPARTALMAATSRSLYLIHTRSAATHLIVKKGERKIKLYKKMELFRNTRNASGRLLNPSPSSAPPSKLAWRRDRQCPGDSVDNGSNRAKCRRNML